MSIISIIRIIFLIAAVICAVIGVRRKRKSEELNDLFTGAEADWVDRVMEIEQPSFQDKKNWKYKGRGLSHSSNASAFNEDEEDFLMRSGVYTAVDIAEAEFQNTYQADHTNFADHHTDNQHHF